MNSRKTYTELCKFSEFRERYDYLRLDASVGIATFGFDRYLNQAFYRSAQWRQIRDEVMARDRGCDLGLEGFEIHDMVVIHHMNPITAHEIVAGDDDILDPEFLITTSHWTHNAIHFSDERFLERRWWAPRKPGDTKLW